MLKKIIISFCWLLGLAGMAMAQQQKTNMAPGKHVKLRFSPLALLEPDMTFMPGVEFRLNQHISIGGDLGYIFSSYREQNYSATGYKIRTELRYYFTQKNRVGWFGGVELGYKWTTTNRSEYVCMGPNCAFSQRVDYKRLRSIPVGSVRFGFQRYLDKKDKVYLEGFVGLGVKVISERKKDYVLPPGAEEVMEDTFNFFNSVDGATPHLPAGMRIGFRL